jgi:predicted AAA+ superfamily ATPase
MEELCHIVMKWCKYKNISKDKDIPIPLIKKYINFLTENCLISTLPYFFTDKTKELSHQETIVIEDMGIKSYMTQHFWSKLHDTISIKNFVHSEIAKTIPQEDICMTYQKINNSSIDFIIVHNDKTITPIVVSDSNTNKPPKVLKSFHTHYGDRVRKYIKTTPLHAERTAYYDKELICVPHFMIKTVL